MHAWHGRHPHRESVIRPASAHSRVVSCERFGFWPGFPVSAKQDEMRSMVLSDRHGGHNVAARHTDRIDSWQKAQKLAACGGVRPGSLALGLPVRFDTLLNPTQMAANKAAKIDFEKNNVPQSVRRRAGLRITGWGESMSRDSVKVSRIGANSVFKDRVYHRRLHHASQRFCHTHEVMACDRRKGQASPNNRHRRPNTALNYIPGPCVLHDPPHPLRAEVVEASLRKIEACLHTASDLGLPTPLARTHPPEPRPGPGTVEFTAEGTLTMDEQQLMAAGPS